MPHMPDSHSKLQPLPPAATLQITSFGLRQELQAFMRWIVGRIFDGFLCFPEATIHTNKRKIHMWVLGFKTF